MLGVGDAAVVAELDALAAGDALLRVDPILGMFEGDGPYRALHSTAVAAGAKILRDLICHDKNTSRFDGLARGG
jgi:hypothetical protein